MYFFYAQWLNENIAILIALAKIQYTRDDEPSISCINKGKNIDNEVYNMSSSRRRVPYNPRILLTFY
jgi:hypothetical protein